MKKSFLVGIFSLLFSTLCLAETPEFRLDFTGKNYNFHHYRLDFTDENLILKKDNRTVLTKFTLTENIKNFTVNNIRKTHNGFLIQTNWGGGNYFYNTQFYFNFDKIKHDFYLVKIGECMLGNATDEKKSYTTFTQQILHPPVALITFDFVKDYQQFYTTQSKPKIAHCNPF